MSILSKTDIGLKHKITITWKDEMHVYKMQTYIKSIDYNFDMGIPTHIGESPERLFDSTKSWDDFCINVVRTTDMEPWIKPSELYLKLKVKFSRKQISATGEMELPAPEDGEDLGMILEMQDMTIISIQESWVKILVRSSSRVIAQEFHSDFYHEI